MKRFSQEDVNSSLLRSFNGIRDKIRIDLCRDYILGLFFIKFITDKVKDEEFFYINLDNLNFDYIYSNRNSDNLGEVINKVLDNLQDLNKTKLDGVFDDLDYELNYGFENIEDRNKGILQIVEELNSLNLSKDSLEDEDIPGKSFVSFIEIVGYELGKDNSNRVILNDLVDLLVGLVNPKARDKVYDPSCGYGPFLVNAFNGLKKDKLEVFGQESNKSLYRLCKINMILNGIEDEDIRLGNPISNPLHLEGNNLKRFDLVISYPPLFLKDWTHNFATKENKDKFEMRRDSDPYNRFELGIPPRNKSDFVYLLHMLTSLNDNGIMGAIVPLGVLFRGAAEGDIRKNIINKNLVDAVILLPEKIVPTTGLAFAIILFKKNRKTEDILMIDASLDKYIINERFRNILKKDVIEDILESYKNYENKEGFSKLTSIDEIIESEYSLYVSRYLQPIQEIVDVDIKNIKKDILRIKSSLAKVEHEIESLINE